LRFAGRSNALNIAERLGMPKDILVEARSLYGVASAQLSEVTWFLMLSREASCLTPEGLRMYGLKITQYN